MRRAATSRWLMLVLCAAVLPCGRALATAHWMRTYGGTTFYADSFAAIEPVPAGGYIAVGSTPSFGGGVDNDVWLVRLDGDGSILWQKYFSDLGEDFGSAVKVTQDGGFVVAANTGPYAGNRDAWILKLDPDGEPQWQRRYGGAGDEGATDIVPLGDGGFAFVGWTWSSGAGQADFWTVKLTSTGDIVWQRTFGTYLVDGAGRVRATRDGRVLVLGSIISLDPFQSTNKILLVKYDPAGQVLAQRGFADAVNGESPGDVVELPGGGYLVNGTTDTPFGGNARGTLHRLDANLNVLWNRAYRIDGRTLGTMSSAAMPDGGALTSGWVNDPPDPWVMRTDPTGAIVWQHQYGIRGQQDAGLAHLLVEADGIVAAGRTGLGPGGGNAVVTRLSPEGLLPPSCGLVQDLAMRTEVFSFLSLGGGVGGTSTATAQDTTAPSVATTATVTTLCEDSDGDGLPAEEDNCPLAPNPAQEDDDGDGVGDACDRCPSAFDPGQADGDADGTGNACDVCPLTPDPAQHDLDDDGQGDACDTDDGMLFFTEVTALAVSWQTDPSFTSYNLYRGSLSVLSESGEYTQTPGLNPCANRACNLIGASVADAVVPLLGEPCFWLVTGTGVAGESGLEDPTSGPRSNQHPCP